MLKNPGPIDRTYSPIDRRTPLRADGQSDTSPIDRTNSPIDRTSLMHKNGQTDHCPIDRAISPIDRSCLVENDGQSDPSPIDRTNSPIDRRCSKYDLRPFVLNLTWAFARAYLAFLHDFSREFLGIVAACHVSLDLGSRIDSCSSHGTKEMLYSSEKPTNDKNTTYAQYQSNKTCYARVCDKNEVDKPLYLHYWGLITGIFL